MEFMSSGCDRNLSHGGGRLMLGAVDIDFSALWHTVVIAFAAGLVAILAAGSVIVSLDRAELNRGPRTGWYATAFVGAIVVAGILVLGLWAMTQK
jgi:hypothetical protein